MTKTPSPSPVMAPSPLKLSSLPEGRPGRILAVAMLCGTFLVAVLILKLLLNTYQARQDTIATQKDRLHRTEQLIASIPTLEDRARRAGEQMAQETPLLTVPSDDLALAELQENVHALADRASLTLTSQEPLSLPRHDQFRNVALRIAFSSSWSSAVHLLDALQQTHSPHLLTEDLQIIASSSATQDDVIAHGQPVDVSLVVVALRSPTKTPSSPAPPSSNTQTW